MLDLINGNILLKDLILKGEPFSVARVGIGELNLFNRIVSGNELYDSDVIQAKNNGGVYGDSFNDFIIEYLEAIKNSEIHCYWSECSLEETQDNLYALTSPNSTKIHHRIVEPYYFDQPWSLALEGKKVLVISPFSETIEEQYKIIDKIWGDKKVLPAFELITYKAVQSIGDLNPHSSWTESLKIMKDDISKIDFDIALLGCGTYGLPLVNFIKKDLGKSAIYNGGAIQILFGIKGKRWDAHPKIKNMYNEYWVRPKSIETPSNNTIVEGGCYW